MLPYGGFAFGRVIQRPCPLFLRCVSNTVIVGKCIVNTEGKQAKYLEQNKSVLEKVLTEEPRAAPQIARGKIANAYHHVAYIISLVIMGGMTYLLYEEILAPGSPQTVFSKAMSLIQKDPKCHELFGDTIVGYTEGRGRMKPITHHYYKKDGQDRIRIKFNVRGSRGEGITTAEMEKINGKWQWRFLIVSSINVIHENAILIDNR